MIQIHSKFDEMVPIKQLKPHPKNRNKHPADQIDRLVKLYEYQGVRHPIIVSNLSGHIVAGHGRLAAAKKLKMETFPVVYQDFVSEEQEYAFIQSDNAVALWAELDFSAINVDITDLGPDFDVDLLGIKNFTVEVADKEPLCDEDEIPEKVEPKAKLGDIYKLGNHRLMCGDSTSIDAVEKLMNGEKADMVFTDPPYNQETEGGFKGMVGKALMKQSAEIEHLCDFNPESFLQTLTTLFEKNKMNALIFCNKDLVVDYLKFARDSSYSYNILFWKKPTAIPIGGSYRPDVEYLLNFRKSAIFNSGLKECNYSKCLEFSREQNKVHPTMKPVEMIENQLKICSNEKSNIVDLFGGSGSTLIACEKTNRKCFMSELDPHYIDVIVQRWMNFTGKMAYLIEDSSGKLKEPVSYAEIDLFRGGNLKEEYKSIAQKNVGQNVDHIGKSSV